MMTATLVCFPNALGTSIIGLSDLLSFCGVSWNYINKAQTEPKFRVQFAAETLEPVACVNGVVLSPHVTFSQAGGSDIVIVPTISGNIAKTLATNTALVGYLRALDQDKTLIASNCTGAFFLAQAGLLENREATTHWAYVEEFRQRFPQVDLKPEKMLTRSANILCSAGGHACFDLGLYLIEQFFGHEQAVKSSKSFVLDMGREMQLSYSPLEASKQHDDPLVKDLQRHIDNHYKAPLSLHVLATASGVSERSIIRRFRHATGDTPARYIQSVRIEKAKQLLENTKLSVSQITLDIGYEDISSFTRLFKRKTGLTPGHYRDRYASRIRLN